MRKLMMALATVSMVAPMLVVATPADARYHAREWRGRDGRTYCRRSDGTTGLIVGGVGGALVGRALDTHGIVGPLLGAAGGALAGREIDRDGSTRHCR